MKKKTASENDEGAGGAIRGRKREFLTPGPNLQRRRKQV